MTGPGTIIDDKYEILKEIGRGGMSIVYLAMDRRLNKQWAIKEIRKKGSGRQDEIVINSLLAEAALMKRLDHVALPRIVDIIDRGNTIYIVMDYIEGESLDKILKEYGAQSEELVIDWAKQLCDALGYLHRQKPPIIYRDMKPANVMLRPDGNIKIIDFGIAREYKEQNLADTTVLGTKGYAPPEQYSGQTDARSDIYSLGMTLHHLLTGNDPRSGEAYVPVRQWNPVISEGMEVIIDRCVAPAPEHRYQTCEELRFDLEHPTLVTKGYKKRLKRRFKIFIGVVIASMLLATVGLGSRMAAERIKEKDYLTLVNQTEVKSFYEAIYIYPDRIYAISENGRSFDNKQEDGAKQRDAYHRLIDYYRNHGGSEDELKRLSNQVLENSRVLDINRAEVADLYYDMGKLLFSQLEGSFKKRTIEAKEFFEPAAGSNSDFARKPIAGAYAMICRFMTNQSETSEYTKDDYQKMFSQMNEIVTISDDLTDGEANYDKLSLYYALMLFVNDQASLLASTGMDQTTVETFLQDIEKKAREPQSILTYVRELQLRIEEQMPDILDHLRAQYNEAEKRRNGE